MDNIIDPHIHLFDRNKGSYAWLKPENPPYWSDKEIINNDFFENDLILKSPLTLSGFVHIEAGFDNDSPWREIEWLESTVSCPFKSVACINLMLDPEDFIDHIKRLKKFSSVIGVRHILDEQAHRLLTSHVAQMNLVYLATTGLHFEAQLSGSDTKGINALVNVARQNLGLTFIISHAAFAPLDSTHQTLQCWKNGMVSLAAFPNIVVKASGWEMTRRDYINTNSIDTVITELLSLFGEDRIMLASNFPLALFTTSYQELWAYYKALDLPLPLLEKLCHTNAKRIYQF
ncbi:amidohydrolase family protein [Moritella sp. 5]|uniref:amidohydrolase family protein n=1 Tax=Moritella sp. 5 TaxID=2746231 RepID=UPI001BA53913|nr:amidohydrolase family protein [Moritella sp. 5]QUM82332.1 amidohydrolase family protein [Moritella sp. 5]